MIKDKNVMQSYFIFLNNYPATYNIFVQTYPITNRFKRIESKQQNLYIDRKERWGKISGAKVKNKTRTLSIRKNRLVRREN